MDSFGSDKEIPLNERFYTGGPTSLRGFGYQLVGPLASEGEPKGGKFKIVWNVLEFRRSIYKIIGGAVFVDAGNIWTDIESVCSWNSPFK
jgi:translocation and assembly module TamA